MNVEEFKDYARTTVVTCSRERIKQALLYEHQRHIGKVLKRITLFLSLVSVMLGTIQFTLPNLDANLDIWGAIMAALVAAMVQLTSYLKPDKKRAIAMARSDFYQKTIESLDSCMTPERLVELNPPAIESIKATTDMTLAQLKSDEDLPHAVRMKYAAICEENGMSNDLITIPKDVSRIRSLSTGTPPPQSVVEIAAPASLRHPQGSKNPAVVAAIERLRNS